jgi:hypothetical protein
MQSSDGGALSPVDQAANGHKMRSVSPFAKPAFHAPRCHSLLELRIALGTATLPTRRDRPGPRSNAEYSQLDTQELTLERTGSLSPRSSCSLAANSFELEPHCALQLLPTRSDYLRSGFEFVESAVTTKHICFQRFEVIHQLLSLDVEF